jgi:hypothetical protein
VALKHRPPDADASSDEHEVRRRLQEDDVKKVPDSVKARVFRGAITISSLVALALAAGAGRKFT